MYFRFPGPIGIIVILVLLMIVLGMVHDMIVGPTPHNGPVATGGPQALPTPTVLHTNSALPGAVSPSPLTPASPAIPMADPASMQRELQQHRQKLTTAAEDQAAALQQIAAWMADVEPLRNNADGRLIAADPELLAQYTTLVDEQRPALREVIQIQERIRELQQETEQASSQQPPAALPQSTAQEIETLAKQAQATRDQWANAVAAAPMLVREARRRPPLTAPVTPPATATQVASTPAPSATPQPAPVAATPPAASPTAPPATATAAPTTAAEPAVTTNTSAPPNSPPPPEPSLTPSTPSPPVTAAPSVPLDEAAQRLRDQQKREELNRQAELAARLKQERQAAEEQRAAVQAKLLAEAQLPEVQLALQPFLTPRTLQPRLAGSSLQFSRTADEEPMSYTAINGVGALQESVQGLSMLARLGSHRELSAPRWSYSPSPRIWSEADQQQLRKVQDLLRRLGPTLVELKLLSP